MPKANQEAVKHLASLNDKIRITMSEHLKNRKEKKDDLPFSISRLDNLCRRDGRNLSPYVTEYFMLWDIWDRNPELMKPLEDEFKVLITDIKSYEAIVSKGLELDLTYSLRELATCLDEYTRAKDPESEDGEYISTEEYKKVKHYLDNVLYKLSKFNRQFTQEYKQRP